MDTVSEFLTRIRNAVQAKHEKVDVPSSKLRKGIAAVLQENGYIRDFRVVNDGKQGMMRVYLKYLEDGKPVIEKLNKISVPGRRKYVASDDIPKVRAGYGLSVLSTNKGVLSGRQAAKENVGGEVLLEIW